MRYILVLLLISFPFFAKSQTTGKDTIKIHVNVAKQIVKDLIKGDSATAELKLCNEHVSALEEKISLKDSIINTWTYKGGMYEQQILNEQEKFKVQGKWVADLQKSNRRLKTELSIIKATAVAIIGGLTYFYITK